MALVFDKVMAKVSVIMPVYNLEDYLNRSINSLVNQSFSDIEIIIIDDGSTDNSQKIIKSYNDKRIKLFTQSNKGSSYARNVAIQNATGEYMMFLDGDDYFEIDCISRAYHSIIKNQSDICIFGSRFIDGDGNEVKTIIPSHHEVIKIKENRSILLEIENCNWDKIYKTSLIKDHQVKFPEGLYYQDYAFTFTSLMYADTISFIDDILINYTCGRQGNITGEISSRIFDIFAISDYIIQSYKQKELYDTYYDELKAIIIINIIDKLKMAVKSSNQKLKKQYIDKTYQYIKTNFKDFNSKYSLLKHPHDYIYFNKLSLNLYLLMKGVK